MKITNLIIKENKIYGMNIEDGSESYPIRIESLHTPIILDTLMVEGWELYGLPFDLRMGNTKLEDLPKVNYADANITEQQEQDMIDTMAIRYKEVDLKAKLVKSPVNYLQFQKSNNLIKTREDLIKFLEGTVGEDRDLSTPTTYMPLNSFVDPSVLLTPEEYFSSENIKIRNLIEKRRTLSFKSYSRLAEFLIQVGLNPDYKAKELVDMYFSWGICGIKFDAFERKNTRSNIILGAPLAHSISEDEMPYVRLRYLTYMDSGGTVHRTSNIQGHNWKPTLKDFAFESKRKEAFNEGYNYVAPVYVESVIDEEITHLVGDSMEVEYTDGKMIITYNNYAYNVPTLRVRRLDNMFKFLHTRFWNVTTEESKEKLFRELYIQSICKEIADKTTVKSNVSSFKALQTTGAGPGNIFTYILEKNQSLKDIIENEKERDMFVIRIVEYMEGTLSQNYKYYSEVETFVNDVVDGNINIDNTSDGQDSDNAEGFESIYQAVYVANKYLGVSLDTIYKQVMNIDVDQPHLDFVGTEKSIRLPITKKDAKRKGYQADINAYRNEQAKTATEWMYVTNTYRELGPLGNRKHAAAEILVFYRDKSTEALENYITNLVNEEISNFVPYQQQEAFRSILPILVSNSLFESVIKGTITFPQSISGRTLNMNAGYSEQMKGYIQTEVESLIGISETTISQDGKFYRYCVNATIMPEYVLPRKGFSVKENSFIPFWFDTYGNGLDGARAQWFAQGMIPNPNYYGMHHYYRDQAVLRKRSDWKNDITSLFNYYNNAEEFRKQFPRDKQFVGAPTAFETKYPNILDIDPFSRELETRTEKVGEEHKFAVGTMDLITRESMFAKFPNLEEFFDTDDKEEERKIGFHKFSGYDAEDAFFLKNFESLQVAPNFGSKIKLLAVMNKTQACLSSTNVEDINYIAVQDLNPETHAVVQLVGRKYLMEDVNGVLWEVRT